MFYKTKRSVIRNITLSSIKSQKNYSSIIAIVLATLLFTSMFTIMGSLRKSMMESDMRKVGTTAHAGLKHLTIDEYKKMCNDRAIKDISYSVIIGSAEGPAFYKLPSEVRWAEDKYAKLTFNLPSIGKMPSDKKEIATSTNVLDALGIPHKLGEKIELSVKTDKGVFTDKFILSGIWQGDTVSYRQTIWLSKSYASEVAPLATVPSEGKSNLSTGYIDSIIMFSSSWDIKDKIEGIATKYNINAPVGVNWAYDTAKIDMQSLIVVIFAIIIIFTSTYLLIYNIFYISVAQDIRSYGLLKIVGTTSKQIRQIVKLKALILSCIGIPLGLLLGWPIGRILVPYIINILGEDVNVVTTASPGIFIISSIFSLLTVYLSCFKPAILASKVSPIESIRYTGIDGENTLKWKNKSGKRVKSYIMAISNLRRSWKKVFVVVLSFSLSLIILNSTYTYVKSFDFNKFVSNTIISDFSVADTSIINSSSPFNIEGVSDKFIKEVKSLEGIEKIGSIYIFRNHQQISDIAHTRLNKLSDSMNDKKKLDLMNSQMMVRKMSVVNTLGLDSWPSEYIKVIKGDLDTDKWIKGEGIYVTRCKMLRGANNASIYEPGDTIDIDFGNGKKKSYEVLAVVDYPQAFNSPEHFDLGLEYIISSQEFLSNLSESKPMYTIFNVDDKYIDKTEKWLKQYCSKVEKSLDFWSKSSLRNTFNNLIVMYNIIGGTLCAIVAIIGILNFINSIIMSIINRKRELAMLQAIGMSGKQMRSMLIFEGCGYSVLGLAFSIVFASIINKTIIPIMGQDIYYFTFKFTLTPILLCIIPLIFITAFIPILCYYKVSKNSIIERLRAIE